jgi:hypothetical protein
MSSMMKVVYIQHTQYSIPYSIRPSLRGSPGAHTVRCPP